MDSKQSSSRAGQVSLRGQRSEGDGMTDKRNVMRGWQRPVLPPQGRKNLPAFIQLYVQHCARVWGQTEGFLPLGSIWSTRAQAADLAIQLWYTKQPLLILWRGHAPQEDSMASWEEQAPCDQRPRAERIVLPITGWYLRHSISSPTKPTAQSLLTSIAGTF